MNTIVESMLRFQVYLKTYHWQTRSHSRHKATDGLYEEISNKIDLFVEVLQGKLTKRITLNGSLEFKNFSDVEGQKLLKNFILWLESDLEKLLTNIVNTTNDLLNIRDEMVANLNQTLYLFSQS